MDMKRTDTLEDPTQVLSNLDALLSHDQSIAKTRKRRILDDDNNEDEDIQEIFNHPGVVDVSFSQYPKREDLHPELECFQN